MTGDYFITIYLDDEKVKQLQEVGLADEIGDVQGEKALRVGFTKKDHKKLAKTFPDLEFDASNACVLPGESEDILFKMILDMKTLDVMKVYILKAYNPLAGKEPRSKVH